MTTTNVLIMFHLFQKLYDFRAIVFTSNNKTIDVCNKYGILTSNRIERNPFGLPYIGSMYTEAYSLVNSSYYGYINADILVSDRIFEVLSYIDTKRSTVFKGSFVFISLDI